MPSIIISDSDDGSVIVAPIDATPDMLQDGEKFASMDQALQAVTKVLGEPDGDDNGGPSDQDADNGSGATGQDDGTGGTGMQDAAGGGAAAAGDEQPPSPEEEAAQMGHGYSAARRGR